MAVLVRVALGVVLALAASVQAGAQPPGSVPADATGAPGVTSFLVENVTRVELWRYFEPPDTGGVTPDYAFVGSRSTLGARYDGARWTVQGALQYVRVENLPQGAIGPGLLGTGGAYYFQAASTFSYQFYLRALSLRANDVVPGVSIEAGRMSFADGAAHRARRGATEDLARERLSGRMIGDMEWSFYQRAWDGVRVDVDRERWRASFAAVLPTQGTFEESANLPMDGLRVATADVTTTPDTFVPNTRFQGFVYAYDDRRDVHVRPDNSAREVSRADVGIVTVGGSAVGVYPHGGGQWDGVVWFAAQTGDWYGQPHRAGSSAAEAGYRWTNTPGSPWLRAGGLYASGDGDGRDDTHRTFFPMLPSGDRYAASNTYALMNLVDVWAEARLVPHAALEVRSAVHRVTLASSADRWYSGSGATERRGNYFGFLGRSARGSTDLGTIVEGSVTWRPARWWMLRGYVGRFAGGEVVRRSFRSDRLLNGWFESTLSF